MQLLQQLSTVKIQLKLRLLERSKWREQSGYGKKVARRFDVGEDGIVDHHVYSVLQAISDVAGSGVDLVLVRNPWGNGEFNNGMWTDVDGLASGWQKYPKVKAQLKPEVADNGLFWMSKEEFFKHVTNIDVCAKSMKAYKVD